MSNANQFRVTAEYLKEQGLSPTFPARFFAKIIITDSCWIWDGNKDAQGRGRIGTTGSANMLCSRASWILHFGPIPENIKVCHDCPDGDNPSCVCPAHLFLGTQRQNMEDAAEKLRIEKGSERWSAKLSELDIPFIVSLRKDFGLSQESTAKLFNVSRAIISGIERGIRWKHVEIH